MVTSDATLLTIFKTWYSDKKLENLMFRNSPVLKELDKKRIGGKEYNFAAMYGAGGNVSASYTKAVANAASSSKNAEFKVQPGKMFTAYNITQQEILASDSNKAAYESAQIAKFFAANENIRKGLAASLYGRGYGEIGYITADVAQGETSFVLDAMSSVIKIDVGTKFQVGDNSNSDPSDPLLATVYTVTGINGLTVTFSPAIVEAAGFGEGAWVCYDGGRSGSTPLFPQGLDAWVPKLADRYGPGWDNYIATSFNGVDRSVAPERLAGAFVMRDSNGNEKYADAIVRGIQAVRRQGGVPDMIILNDEDWATIQGELTAQTNYFQSINTGDKKSKNAVTKGITDMQFAFSTSFLDIIYDDPYCPKGTAYILDMSNFSFISLSNMKPVDDGVSGNEPGSPDVDVDGKASTNYELLLDDYLDIRPASDTDDGPGQRVSISVYANYVIHNTAHTCVIKLS